jgi:hypothetical protein
MPPPTAPAPPDPVTPQTTDSDPNRGVSLVAPQPTVGFVTRAKPPSARPPDDGLALRLDLKLPIGLLTDYSGTSGGINSTYLAPVPQLVLGLHIGRIGVGAGLGFSRVGSTGISVISSGGATSAAPVETTSSDSNTELLVAPTFTVDAFQSQDHKVALYLLGAPLFGVVLNSNQSSLSDLGFQFAVGVEYAVHENFHVGLEVGPVGHFYSGGSGTDHSTMTLYTAIVGTFAYPR